MLIGAYRDNEVNAAHPLMRKLDAIRGAGGRVSGDHAGAARREAFGQLIADALRCEPKRAAPLAQLVHEKTGGNPFFVIQFLIRARRRRAARLRSRARAGPGISSASTPRDTPTMSWTSWSASSTRLPQKRRTRCSSWPVSATSLRRDAFAGLWDVGGAGPRGVCGGGPSGTGRAARRLPTGSPTTACRRPPIR